MSFQESFKLENLGNSATVIQKCDLNINRLTPNFFFTKNEGSWVMNAKSPYLLSYPFDFYMC